MILSKVNIIIENRGEFIIKKINFIHKINSDNSGFALIEIILSVIITAIVLYGVVNYFSLDAKINKIQNSISTEQDLSQFNVVRNLIHYSKLNESKNLISGIPQYQQSNKFIFKSTYLSNNNVSRICTIEFDSNNNNLIFYENNNRSDVKILMKNVKYCTFTYQTINNTSTNNSSDIKMVKISINYLNNKGENKSIEIISKLMQET